jgi:hypothetical protein
MFVPSVEDYEKWRLYTGLVNRIPRIEEELDVWDNRDNVPFRERPTFGPIYSREDVAEMKLELKNFDRSFVAPVRVKRIYEDEE